jgi:hypothetical protein
MAVKKPTGPSLTDLLRTAAQEAKRDMTARDTPVAGEGAPVPPRPAIYNVLEYIESSWGLGMRLFPVQRFIVKLYYHLPLEDRVKTIRVTDMFNTRVIYEFTEVEYLQFLYNEGRCNIGVQDHERRELLLAIGRRAGKTTLSGIFASYEVYRLLNLNHPQGYYGLPNGNRIQIISVATDKEQAGILFNEVTTHLSRCEYFKPYIANNTQSHIQFRTPNDIEKYGPTSRHENGKFTSFNGKATLRVTFKSCIAKGLRGSGNVVVIMDEMAHFKDTGQSSAAEVYGAVTPSTAAFSPKDPNDSQVPIGPVDSRIICISSPLNKSGKFYELYHQAMSRAEGSENMLAIQGPTWEVNPTVDPSYYRQRYHSDPATFMVEHGAQFSDRIRGWIERDVDLLECIDPNLRPKEMGVPRQPHALGIDVGLIGDGTGVAITHVEGDKIILDYHELWRAGEDWRETNPHLGTHYPTPYAQTLATVDRLDFDEIAKWIFALSRRFYFADGLFDRWNGIPLEQSLTKLGLSQLKSEFFTRDVTSKMFQSVKLLMLDKRLSLYDWPKGVTGKRSPLIGELLALQAEQVSRNVITVQAPAGCHDDASDALIRSFWLSSQRLSGGKRIAGTSPSILGGQGSSVSGPVNLTGYNVARARQHGVFTERRTAPRGGRGRF